MQMYARIFLYGIIGPWAAVSSGLRIINSVFHDSIPRLLVSKPGDRPRICFGIGMEFNKQYL
jgi:hypothetical protein